MFANELVLKIGGEAGYGIMLTGRIFAKACTRSGLNVYAYSEYPSLIRGGHNIMSIRASSEQIYSPVKTVNILIALNKETIDKHQKYLAPSGVIIYDSDEIKEKISFRRDISIIPVPMQELASQVQGIKIMRNIVSLGAAAALINLDLKILEQTIISAFRGKHKASEIVQKNLGALKHGHEFLRSNKNQRIKVPGFEPMLIFNNFKSETSCRLNRDRNKKERIILDGNEAIVLGALKAGCKFYAAYPMTPATSILHELAVLEREYGLIVKQTEDEISAINMAIGAGYAGVRAMCATSGGGFCLMTEGLGLAGMTESPVVVVNAQRPGPSTGLPTRTEQGDLRFMIHASQGEFPRAVIAPGDINECFYETFNAFNLAEKYHLPVIILTDKFLAASYVSAKQFETNNLRVAREGFAKTPGKNYLRYAFTSSGVSPRSVPGEKEGIFIAAGNEHDPYGRISENSENRIKMIDKRSRKLRNLAKELPEPKLYSSKHAKLTIISFGSLKGPILEAIKILDKEKIKVNYLHFSYVYPLKTKTLQQTAKKAKKLLLIEQNSTAQFGSLIKEHALIDIPDKLLKYDGRQLTPEEICEKIRKIIK